MGRTTTYETTRSEDPGEVPANGEDLTGSGADEVRTITDSAGNTVRMWTAQDRGAQVMRLADGTTTTQRLAGDPRFGMHSPHAVRSTVEIPGQGEVAIEQSREVTLDDPADPFSVNELTTTTKVNPTGVDDPAYTTVYDGQTRVATSVTPGGRTGAVQLDAKGRIAAVAAPGAQPVAYDYDDQDHGLLKASAQGDREAGYAYDAAGNLAQVTDSLGRVQQFEYDDAGRLTLQRLPDLREIAYDYDDDGNLIKVTPPARRPEPEPNPPNPEHAFEHDPVGDRDRYIAPAIANGGNPIRYSYNDDGQLTKLRRADDSELRLSYDPPNDGHTDGRLHTVAEAVGPTAPDGPTTTLAYAGQTGKLAAIDAPGNVGLEFDFLGPLPQSETLTVPGQSAQISATAARVHAAQRLKPGQLRIRRRQHADRGRRAGDRARARHRARRSDRARRAQRGR